MFEAGSLAVLTWTCAIAGAELLCLARPERTRRSEGPRALQNEGREQRVCSKAL